MLDSSRSAPSAERRGVPSRALLVIGLLLCLAAAVGVWIAYRELIHYQRRAALHLLPEAEFAARLDVEQVVLFEPVRRRLIPLLGAPLSRALGLEESDTGTPSERRLHQLREVAGLNLGLDLRELVAASTGGGDWALVLGGFFPEHGLVQGIEAVLRAEGFERLQSNGERLIVEPWGVALGQATDGVLIVASSARALDSVLSPNARYAELGMPREGAGSIVLSPGWLERWLATGAERAAHDNSASRQLPGVRIVLQLERRLELEASLSGGPALDAGGEPAQELLAAHRARVAFGAESTLVPGTDLGVVRAATARAQLEEDPTKPPIIHSFLEMSEFDEALAALGSRLERSLMPPDSEY